MKSVQQLFALVLVLIATGANSEEVVPLHSTGGTAGPNGVKERVAFKIVKTAPGKDRLALLVDLGGQRFTSNHPDELKHHIVTLTLGTLIVQGETDDKAQINSETMKLRVVANGAGLRIDVRKSAFANLLSELSGRTGDVDLQLTILADHVPEAGTEPEPTETLYSRLLGLEISESEKILAGRG